MRSYFSRFAMAQSKPNPFQKIAAKLHVAGADPLTYYNIQALKD